MDPVASEIRFTAQNYLISTVKTVDMSFARAAAFTVIARDWWAARPVLTEAASLTSEWKLLQAVSAFDSGYSQSIINYQSHNLNQSTTRKGPTQTRFTALQQLVLHCIPTESGEG